MKIVIYCQHVLGIGHLQRILEISRALNHHRVILATGGEDIGIHPPEHVRQERLPGLMMDNGFHRLHTTDGEKTLEAVKRERRTLLWQLFERERPNIFLIELYPFGRKAFRFELDPILKGIRDGELPSCKVICSLRDILVEKTDVAAYENRVVTCLNTYFDALFIHADPVFVKLEETFGRMQDIMIPVHYTGFVGTAPKPEAGADVRRHLGLQNNDPLIIASAGGGKVGGRLLSAVVKAITHLPQKPCLQVFTGPFLGDTDYARLKSWETATTRIHRFSPDFLSLMDAADLSISMAGYNTCMNILATRVPALVFPFSQNREQRMRAERLADLGWLQVLEEKDLEPQKLASLMSRQMNRPIRPRQSIALKGAEKTAMLLDLL
jgi:predicted glycosyltransferase